MKSLFVILFLSFASLVLAESVDESINSLKDSLPIPPGLNTTGLPSTEEAEEIFKKKCLKEADEETYNKAVAAKDEIGKCIQGLVNVEELKKEIEDAKPTGDLDVVFKKYCGKSPLLTECVKNFTDVIEPCFTEKEQANIKLVLNITESLTSFICYKEGDRIALFIAEGGPECFTEKQNDIQDCVNSSMSKYIPTETPSLDNLPELLLKAEQCDDIVKMQDCIVKKLEECEQPTPANIAESLFKFIKQVTPCGKKAGNPTARNTTKADNTSPPSGTGSAASVISSSILIATLALFVSM